MARIMLYKLKLCDLSGSVGVFDSQYQGLWQQGKKEETNIIVNLLFFFFCINGKMVIIAGSATSSGRCMAAPACSIGMVGVWSNLI